MSVILQKLENDHAYTDELEGEVNMLERDRYHPTQKLQAYTTMPLYIAIYIRIWYDAIKQNNLYLYLYIIQ